jgi:hypothetical protein
MEFGALRELLLIIIILVIVKTFKFKIRVLWATIAQKQQISGDFI